MSSTVQTEIVQTNATVIVLLANAHQVVFSMRLYALVSIDKRRFNCDGYSKSMSMCLPMILKKVKTIDL